MQLHAWEITLVNWAYHALDSHIPVDRVHRDSNTLSAAYRYCDEITRIHSRTFYMASGLLPQEKRMAVRALYAFCRVTDDLVDRATQRESVGESLEDWRMLALSDHPPADEPVALAWADARARFNIPKGYAEQLIDGVARDLEQSRYATFSDLAGYAYGVASTVGLMAMHIIGFRGEEAIPYAVKLGVALQLTNILRDVGEDWRTGRLYLPQDELTQFGLGEADIANGRCDERWGAFMRFQIERNRRLYAESFPGVAMLNADGRFAIAAAADLYRAILTDIEGHSYNVFTRRAHVGAVGKLSLLPGIWWRSRSAAVTH